MNRWLGLALLTAACTTPQEEELVRFNSDDDALVLQVGDVGADEPEVRVPLMSTTGAAQVGEAWITPGASPVGTEHVFTVQLDRRYASRIEKVDVEVDSADRGVRTFDLTQDSAATEIWVAELTSYGVPGEERTDEFFIRVWESASTAGDPVDDTAFENIPGMMDE